MATERVHVLYEHDPADLQVIALAVVRGHAMPGDQEWRPAYRDTIAGQRCVWAAFEVPARAPVAPMVVWLKDRAGPRRVMRWTPPPRQVPAPGSSPQSRARAALRAPRGPSR